MVWIYQQNIQLVFYIKLAFINVNLLAAQYQKGNPTLDTLLQLLNTMLTQLTHSFKQQQQQTIINYYNITYIKST